MKIIKNLFIPLESSYNASNDLILINLKKAKNIEELPELVKHQGLQKIEVMYKLLGYETNEEPELNSTSKYPFRNTKNMCSKFIHRSKSPIITPKMSRFGTLNDNSILNIAQKDSNDSTPLGSSSSSNNESENIDDLSNSMGSINDEINYVAKKKSIEEQDINFNISYESSSPRGNENYEASPATAKKEVNASEYKELILPLQRIKLHLANSQSVAHLEKKRLFKMPDEAEIIEFIFKELKIFCSRIESAYGKMFNDIEG